MTSGSTATSSVTVLCPMRIERVYVRRALDAAGLAGVPVVQTGIGKDAVVRAVNAAAGGGRRLELVILAGACGGLVAGEDCPAIARVVDEAGHKWVPFAPDAGMGGVTLVGVDRIVSTPQDKATLAAATGAAVVDMESHALAAHCGRLGVRWSVVRAVSDTPDDTLPHEVLGWITPEGNERHLRAAWDMLRKPSLYSSIRAVVERSERALPLAGRRVVQIIQAHCGPPSPHTVACAGSRS